MNHMPPSHSLATLRPLDASRIARACRNEAYRLRQRISTGRVPFRHVSATRERIASLELGEHLLQQHSAFAGAAPDHFVSLGEAAERVVEDLRTRRPEGGWP